MYPTLDAADYATAKQFSFVVSPSTEYFTRYINSFQKNIKAHFFITKFLFFCFFSFLTDYQLVADARLEVTFKEDRPGAVDEQESLYPSRHNITLPSNSLNFMFDACRVAFNQSTTLTSDL